MTAYLPCLHCGDTMQGIVTYRAMKVDPSNPGHKKLTLRHICHDCHMEMRELEMRKPMTLSPKEIDELIKLREANGGKDVRPR